MSEWLNQLPLDPVVIAMLFVCAIACVIDLRSRKIPNWLVGFGLVLTLALQHVVWGSLGIKSALFGIGVAFIATLPFVITKAIAAGDSKLLLVVGAALGPIDMLIVFALSFVFAGVLGLTMTVLMRRFGLFSENLSLAAVSASVGDLDGLKAAARQTAFRIPFAFPILVAALVWLFWFY